MIKSHDYGEGNRIVVVFTEQYGLIKATARGSRKTKSKFGAMLEPLSENSFMLYKKPDKPLFTITGCKVNNSHVKIRDNMLLYGYGALVIEFVDILFLEEDPNDHVYEILQDSLISIEQKNSASASLLAVFKLMKYAGYRLNFFECSKCNNKELGNMCFVPALGGVLCKNCSSDEPVCWDISGTALTTIKKLLHNPMIENEIEMEIGKIVKKFIKYQFNKEINSFKFIEAFKK